MLGNVLLTLCCTGVYARDDNTSDEAAIAIGCVSSPCTFKLLLAVWIYGRSMASALNLSHVEHTPRVTSWELTPSIDHKLCMTKITIHTALDSVAGKYMEFPTHVKPLHVRWIGSSLWIGWFI